MPTFKDANGKEWLLTLDAPTIRMVRSELDGLDLASADGQVYEQLQDDPCQLVDCIWVLCREQAISRGVTDVDFGKALVGEVIDQATAALLNAIVDFSPTRKRELLKAVAAKNAKLRELGTAKALAKINDPEVEAQILAGMEARMDAHVRNGLTRLSPATSSLASSESVPAA